MGCAVSLRRNTAVRQWTELWDTFCQPGSSLPHVLAPKAGPQVHSAGHTCSLSGRVQKGLADLWKVGVTDHTSEGIGSRWTKTLVFVHAGHETVHVRGL